MNNNNNKIIIIVLMLIAVVFNSQMDIIAYTPSKAWSSGWWIAQNWQQPFWQKYLLPMTVDGWHLCKFIFLSSISAIAVIAGKFKWFLWVVIMLSWGIIFNLLFLI